MKIKIIVGANFGDEGKGLITDYLASRADKKCIVVKANGGSQAGHTVTTSDFKRHVFHHFGSGTFENAATYLSEDFIVNPLVFRKEREELMAMGINPVCYINKHCLVTTPYDMLINQLLEESRKGQKHGSCGFGIYETIVRNQEKKYTVSDFNVSFEKVKTILNTIKTVYSLKRLKELHIDTISEEMQNLLESETLLYHFIDDLEYFYQHSSIIDDSILLENETILFECGQGLLLDQNNTEYMPHLTPSNTGIKNPVKILHSLENSITMEIELCYVTRTYVTRHGMGRFDLECDKEEIGSSINDLTNVSNPFQDTLRYGFFDIELFAKSIKNDLKNFDIDNQYSLSLCITHLNETNNTLKCKGEDLIVNSSLRQKFQEKGLDFDKFYLSNGLIKEQVYCKEIN